jgi:hypothetical protein
VSYFLGAAENQVENDVTLLDIGKSQRLYSLQNQNKRPLVGCSQKKLHQLVWTDLDAVKITIMKAWNLHWRSRRRSVISQLFANSSLVGSGASGMEAGSGVR